MEPPRLTNAAAHPFLPMRALLTALTAIAALGLADGASAATVARVIDGDTVALRDGRKVDLLGVEIPACYAGQARAKLRRLLPARAKVRVQSDPGHDGRYVFRGKTLINAELIRAGAAQAAAAGLAQAAKLTAAEAAAKSRTRGLWKTCPPAPGAGARTHARPPAADPKDRAFGDLRGRAFIHITTTSFSSAESHLHLCSDGTYVEDVSTYSDFGGSTVRPLHRPLAGHRGDLRHRRRPRDASAATTPTARPAGSSSRPPPPRSPSTATPVSVQTSGVCA